MPDEGKNVLGEPLEPCCEDPITGYFRTGRCETDQTDQGLHVICARMTDAFLEFTRSRGNDLSTPRPDWGFPGLKDGDQWCLCAARWKEALAADKAPPVYLRSTHQKALTVVSIQDLREYALDL